MESVFLDIDEDEEIDSYMQSMITVDENVKTGVLFTCDNCNKKYKTTGGLSRHQAAKHGDANGDTSILSKVTPSVIKELSEISAKKVSNEAYYPEDILSELKSFNLNLGQAEVIYSLFKDVIETHSKNPEKFYPKFYGIVGDIIDFGNLSKNAIIIIGFELANQVMCFVKKSHSTGTSLNSNEGDTNIIKEITKREKSIIVYLSGYVVSNIYRKIRNSHLWERDESQEKLALLRACKEADTEVTSDECYKLVNTKNRGGLWYTNNNAIEIFMKTENVFKIETSETLSCIDSNKIVKKVMGDGMVKMYYNNIQDEAGILVDKEIALNLLEQLIMLYVRVRSHSFAKQKIEAYKVECKTKKARSLRTEMKRSLHVEK